MDVEELTRFDRELLRTLLDTIDDAVVATDTEGTIVAWNAGAERLFGRPAAEAIGRTDDITRRRDGSPRDLHSSASPLRGRDGRLLGTLTVVRDETRSKVANEAQAQLAAIVTSSELAIISEDLDGTIRTWNRGAELLYGWTAEEAVGRHITMVVPEELVGELEAMFGRVARGERPEPFEARRRRKDGTIRDVAILLSPIVDDAGTVTGFSAITRDVTEERRRERHETELELRLANVQRLESLGRLAGGVAHDFNNLLAVMLNSTAFVREAIEEWSRSGAGDPPAL